MCFGMQEYYSTMKTEDSFICDKLVNLEYRKANDPHFNLCISF